MRGWVRIVGVAAVLMLATMPALAQQGLIQQGYREFRTPAPTTDAIVAARGNILRWRDQERARIGPYSRENGYLVDPVLRDGGGPSVGRKVCMSTAFRLAN